MAKYTKHNSNYIRTERHQHLNDSSSIFERDWVTIGSQLSFGPGKRIIYNDGNFIFTRSTSPFYFKKYKTSVDVGTWTYDDVKDATSQINQINSDEYSEDIRTYAYYGSCVELVRSSIENIINWFPGNIKVSNSQPEETTETSYLLLDNPFEINLYVKDVNLTKYDNIMRYLSFSWENYVLKNNEKIIKYNSTTRSLYEKNKNNTKIFQMFSNEEYYNLEDREDWVKSRCHLIEWLPGDGNNPVYEVKLNDNITISGWILNDTLLDFVESDTEFTLTPSKEIIEDYFNNLHCFEKQLLNRKNKPIYTNTFVTPIEYNLGYVFYKRTYTWPSNDYCIDISSVMYLEFLNNLTNMAELYDELCTDNIWRKMTHEAIKNYDWTYTKEYAEGDEEENIEGGERMHKVLNIIARVFDDVKRNIDLVKKNNRITYNGDRNMPNALLSDKLELYGWNVYSTIPTYKMLEDSETQTFKELPANEIKIDDDFLSEYNIRWYDTKNNNEITFADVDVDFMRKLVLSSKRMFETKGTNHSIDMIMAMFGYGRQGEKPDYEISETYHTTTPRAYDEEFIGNMSMSLGDRIVSMNMEKQKTKLYYDDTSGIPINKFTIEKETDNDSEIELKTYLIPYYDSERVYDGDFIFQSNGGWLYDKKSDDEDSYWTETVSYLHVVPTVGDLLNINPTTTNEGDIFYVSNVNDYVNYIEFDDSGSLYSNFFVLEDLYNIESIYAWTNLDLTGEIYHLPEEPVDPGADDYEDGYTEEDIEKYKKYVKKANYLNELIPYNIGNNPHVGYGYYDNGNEYLEYMRKPFKYSIDNHLLSYESEQDAENITFEISDPIITDKLNEKVKIFANSINVSDIITYGGKRNLVYKGYDEASIKEMMKTTYYLNSKVIYMKNNLENDNYKNYFKNVIIKYLMQIIPSTAILILEDF